MDGHGGGRRPQRLKWVGAFTLAVWLPRMALALPVEEAWRPAVRANLEVSLRLARLVDEFALPDETEPAPVFTA